MRNTKFYHQDLYDVFNIDEQNSEIIIRVFEEKEYHIEVVYGDPCIFKNGVWKKYHADMYKYAYDGSISYYKAKVTSLTKRFRYFFKIYDKAKKFLYYLTPDGLSEKITKNLPMKYFNMPYLNKENLLKTPSWVKGSVYYQIFPDRFYKEGNDPEKFEVVNNNIYGGNLKEIEKKIPYLNDLGITCIYMTPIFKADTAHKYDTVDYFTIDPSFGDINDLRNLVNTAHKYNIKVMLDGVFNHMSFFHPFFQDALKNKKDSKYYNYFNFLKDNTDDLIYSDSKSKTNIYFKDVLDQSYETFATVALMPKLNFENKGVQEFVLSVIEFWIKEANIDGWRLDVANEISYDLLRKIQDRAKSISKDVFVLGEIWDFPLYWIKSQCLDNTMNYQLSYLIWDLFYKNIDNQEFINQLSKYIGSMPSMIADTQYNLVSSHDTERIYTRVGEDYDKFISSYNLLFFMPGTPSIYYGDEIAMKGAHDPKNRAPWFQKDEVLKEKTISYFKNLIKLYKNTISVDNSIIKPFLLNDVIVLEKKTISLLFNNNNSNKVIKYKNKLYELKPYESIFIK